MISRTEPGTFDLDELRSQVLPHDGGSVDESIPRLAEADPDFFSAALALKDGRVRGSQQSNVRFAMQSSVKPFLFALALLDTEGEALERVGIEPTGEAFDAIKLESGTGRPPNPMVNAGALLTASLVDGGEPGAKSARILRGLSAFAGRTLEIDERTAREEREHGDRNHALAHLMIAEKVLHVSADDAVEAYGRACAVLVDAEALAVMGATLAFGGVNPVSGARVVPARVARDVVAVMATCGVYDGSGTWMRSVGVPAKSSVSGAIVLSAPRMLGAAVVSPPLDEQGTSVRGRISSEILSTELGLHAFAS